MFGWALKAQGSPAVVCIVFVGTENVGKLPGQGVADIFFFGGGRGGGSEQAGPGYCGHSVVPKKDGMLALLPEVVQWTYSGYHNGHIYI